MALGDPYSDLPSVKNRFDIDDENDDSALEQALKAASRGVERFCRRQFNRTDEASLRRYRATSRELAKVDDFYTVDGLVVTVDGATWVEGEDFELEPTDGVVDGQPGWPFWRIRAVGSRVFPLSRRPLVNVSAPWGWAEVPNPVTDVAEQVAAELFKLRDAPFGVAGFGEFGAVRVRKNPNFAAMLAPYRRDAVLVA